MRRHWHMLVLVMLIAAAPVSADEAVATFGGGCFWCMEPPYDKLDGVKSTVSGYMGGDVEDPSYEQVTAGGTGHVEVVQVTYDPEVVDYEKLLEVYWRNIDPFDAGGQFCDRGASYRPVIFFHDATQEASAHSSRQRLEKQRFDKPIETSIEQAGEFWRAEDYHQDYYEKNPLRYRFYRFSCGRDERLKAVWGPDESE